jgi:hypothetical protein
VGAAQGINQAAQCVGAILIAPLIKRWPTRSVLATAVLFFSLMTTILLIVDAATGMYFLFHHRRPAKFTVLAGGKIRFNTKGNEVHYGDWNPNAVRCHTTPFTRTQSD